MKTHKDLDVWKESIELVTKIYRLVGDFPKEERMKNNVSRSPSHVSRVISVVGARPNFMEIFPIIRAIGKFNKESMNFGLMTTGLPDFGLF